MSGSEDENLEELMFKRNLSAEENDYSKDTQEDVDELLTEKEVNNVNCDNVEENDPNEEEDESFSDDEEALTSSSSDESEQENTEKFNETEALHQEQIEEIDSMLESAVAQQMPKRNRKKIKRILEFRGTDHFDVLPDGWVEVTHHSGLPVYLHKPTRCCTFGRPYFLGPGSLRRHKVPESAIPCYFQKKLYAEADKMNEEKNRKSNPENLNPQNQNPSENTESCKRTEIFSKLNAPDIKIRTAEDLKKNQLTPDQLFQYASKGFRFKNLSVFRFDGWSEARHFFKNRRKRHAAMECEEAIKLAEASTSQNENKKPATHRKFSKNRGARPGLPGGAVLITVPELDNNAKPFQFYNPQGKTSINVLHELVQKILKCTVQYSESETRSCATPYHCVARLVPNNANKNLFVNKSIEEKIKRIKQLYEIKDSSIIKQESEAFKQEEDWEIGQGFGKSKKFAKLAAAKQAVNNLFPEIKFDDDGMAISYCKENNENENLNRDDISSNNGLYDSYEIFDCLSITDTRIPELCARAGQPTPFLILQEYLKNHAVFGNTEISTHTRRICHQRHEYTLTVGSKTVRVTCVNKREGKQKASQQMLNEIFSKEANSGEVKWGWILRKYGVAAQLKQKSVRKTKDSIIQLQEQVRAQNEKNYNSVEPNTLILDKLKSEMLKLAEKLSQNLPKPVLDTQTNSLKRKAEISESENSLLKCPRKELIQLAEPLPISPERVEDTLDPEVVEELTEREKFQEITPENSPRPEKFVFEGEPLLESNIEHYEIVNLEDEEENPEKNLKEFADLSEDELKNLLNSSQMRNSQIGFTEQPVLDEAKLREQSAKLAELFPDTEIQLPKFFQNN